MRTFAELVEKTKGYTLEGLEAGIRCPTLCLVGEAEPARRTEAGAALQAPPRSAQELRGTLRARRGGRPLRRRQRPPCLGDSLRLAGGSFQPLTRSALDPFGDEARGGELVIPLFVLAASLLVFRAFGALGVVGAFASWRTSAS